MEPLLEAATTAVVVIDLQQSVLARTCTPFLPEQVVANAARLAAACREAGGWVVFVRVASVDGKDRLHPRVDAPVAWPVSTAADPSALAPALGPAPTDFVLTKHQWGAFHGTELDLQLRRRGMTTIVLCGIATGYGVDTTAREAYQHGYEQVFAVDAMTGIHEGEHQYVCDRIFPRMGRLRTTDEIVAAFASPRREGTSRHGSR